MYDNMTRALNTLSIKSFRFDTLFISMILRSNYTYNYPRTYIYIYLGTYSCIYIGTYTYVYLGTYTYVYLGTYSYVYFGSFSPHRDSTKMESFPTHVIINHFVLTFKQAMAISSLTYN